MDEVLSEFLVESGELLDQMEREMVAFEAGTAGPDAIRTIFRAIHTIKGTCGFLGMQRLQAVTHTGENLLSALRDGELTVTPDITSALLALVDAVRRTLATIEQTGSEGEPDFAGLIRRLSAQMTASSAAAAAPPPPPAIHHAAAPASPPPAAKPEPKAAPKPEPKVEAKPAPKKRNASSASLPAIQAVPTPAPAAPPSTPPAAIATPAPGAAPKAASAAALPALASAPELAEPHSETSSPTSEAAAAAASIRVPVGVLDKLMTLVGELVLVRNQVLRYAATNEDSTFAATSQRLNVLTSELQEGVMKSRMQPIGNVMSKLPRVVRDLAHETNKQARVVVEGAETELDKTILEAIKDPLTHLVRNAIDHGIEAPAARQAKGKSPEGRLLLRAFHEGGQVNIEIADDGNGIDIERVRRKAIERGLLTAEQAMHANDREVTSFVFLPGFSTAEKVTSVSGRGVGMDVVKTNVEKIGGSVEINSVHGQGTTFKIRIPLTLAIIPALIVRNGKERYAIPQGSVLEVVRLAPEKAKKGIEYVHSSPVYRLRGNLLPLVELQKILVDEHKNKVVALGETDPVNIVVLHSDKRQFGLLVDGVEDTQEIVVKPLDPGLKGIPIFAGSTIMGDGRVALILDVSGAAQQAQVFAQAQAVKAAEAAKSDGVEKKNKQRLLLLEARDQGRMAIPLAQVARLEELPRDQVEMVGDVEVIQYRNQIMPLIRVSTLLPERRSAERLAKDAARELEGGVASNPDDLPLQVVVHRAGDRDVGIVVERIVDVVEEALSVQRPSSRRGVLFSVVLGNRVTEMLDVAALVSHVQTAATSSGVYAAMEASS